MILEISMKQCTFKVIYSYYIASFINLIFCFSFFEISCIRELASESVIRDIFTTQSTSEEVIHVADLF